MNEYPPLLWEDCTEDPSGSAELWCVSATAQQVRWFQHSVPTTGSAYLPLSRNLQRTVEAYILLTAADKCVSNEPQILRLNDGWRIGVWHNDSGRCESVIFRRQNEELLRVLELIKMPVSWMIPTHLRTTMNRMQE